MGNKGTRSSSAKNLRKESKSFHSLERHSSYTVNKVVPIIIQHTFNEQTHVTVTEPIWDRDYGYLIRKNEEIHQNLQQTFERKIVLKTQARGSICITSEVPKNILYEQEIVEKYKRQKPPPPYLPSSVPPEKSRINQEQPQQQQIPLKRRRRLRSM